MPAALFTALVCMLVTWAAAARAEGVRVIEPRSFGYFVGDTLSRRVEIDLGPGERVDVASLPQRGPVTYWLELRSATLAEDLSGSGGKAVIDLDYQSFYVPIDPKMVTIPQVKVRVKRGKEPRDAVIPAFSLVMSPIREIFPERSGAAAQTLLRPDAVPQLIPTGALRNWVMGSALSSLLALGLLARHRAWWPFTRRESRPFSRAARAIWRAGEAIGTSAGYRQAMLELHRAFDATNGRALLADDVELFLRTHAAHAASQEPIEKFFQASRLLFFGGDVESARKQVPVVMLTELSRALAEQERAVR